MSLKYALLGFLNYGTMTGYELKQRFDHSVQHFWNANLSQIYPTLSQMEKEGLLVMEVEYQESRPNRKVYKITDTGRQELKRWLGEPMDLAPVRIPFLIKVFFGANIESERVAELIRHQIKLHREKLDEYMEISSFICEAAQSPEIKRDAQYWQLSLKAGIRFETAFLEWLEEAINTIEEMDSKK
ncbi:MAG: PadR family transcriptional regulator [Bacillota bacterium]